MKRPRTALYVIAGSLFAIFSIADPTTARARIIGTIIAAVTWAILMVMVLAEED